MPWKLVLDEAAFHFFVSQRPPERRQLFALFQQLRQDPQRGSDYHTKDSTGRPLNVWARKPFLITFWIDSFVREVRVVDIERVAF